MVIAVDFDGTIVEDKYPGVGSVNLELVQLLKEQQKGGDKIVLWTSRAGQQRELAVKICELVGLHFDAVNDRPDVERDIEEGFSPPKEALYNKLFADVYIDDRSLTPEQYLDKFGKT